jgi:OOP family OmpA-OmpF porin
MLRNDDGISLIDLLPGLERDKTLAADVAALAGGAEVSDMLETADYVAPEGWNAALAYGLEALRLLPRSKISIAADQVSITAISASMDEKRKLEAELARRKPDGLAVKIEISAPRPVLTPFTLRFVHDDAGARFDACSADTARARTTILAAGREAGTLGKVDCVIGLGVPTPRWADAVSAGILAVGKLGGGTITFSDADVSLLAGPEVTQAAFDRVVGELQADLPPVFSLQATMPPKENAALQGPSEFTATLEEGGEVQMRGRLTDQVLRHTATRLDPELPDGWAVRVLAGIDSLAILHAGNLIVRADVVELNGVTGRPDGRARISQILSDKLGQGQTFRVNVTYDEKFDPLAALPSEAECAADVTTVLTRQKINFAPGSAEIDGSTRDVMDALAEILENCPPMKMEVAGYTDSQGSEGGNQALSQARAEAVLTALQGRRLDVSGFIAKGYGEADPIADNTTEIGREVNRRIEIHLIPGPEPTSQESQDVAPTTGADQTTLDPSLTTGVDAIDGRVDERVAQANPVPVDGTPGQITIPDDQEYVFEPTDETSPRPRRRP